MDATMHSVPHDKKDVLINIDKHKTGTLITQDVQMTPAYRIQSPCESSGNNKRHPLQ